MAKIEKSLSTKKDTNGKSRLMLRVVYTHGVTFRLKTSVFVTPSLFDAKSGEVIVPRKSKSNAAVYDVAVEESAAVKSFISRIETILATELPEGMQMSKEYVVRILELQDDKKINLATDRLTMDKIQNALMKADKMQNGISDDSDTLLSQAIINYAECKNLSKYRTSLYYTISNKILRFEEYRSITERKNNKIRLKDLTSDLLTEFCDYYKEEYNLIRQFPNVFSKIDKIQLSDKQRFYAVRPCGNNCIADIKRRIRTVINWYKTKGVSFDNTVDSFDLGTCLYGKPIYISKEERNQIANYNLSGESEDIQLVRDTMILQSLIGCRVGDLERLTHANITNGVLEYVPNKTKLHQVQVKPRVPLCAKAIEIIEHYKGKDPNGRLLPFLHKGKYNILIKQVFRICGITRTVIVRNPLTGMNEAKPICDVASSHMMRRTFIGAAYKAVKDPNLVGTMSGHVPGSTAFYRYRTIDDEDLREVINCIE